MATEKVNITIVLTNPFLLIVYGVLTGMAFIAVENFDSTNKDDLTLAIVEPKTPYTDDEVMEFLKNSNASEFFQDRKSTRLNSSHMSESRMPSSA